MQKRIEWVDILKGIGIILVVLGHSINPASYLDKVIFSFHMPLFFFIAGYLYREQPFGTFVIRKAQRLLLPYFFTGFLIYWYWYLITKPLTDDPNSMWIIAKIVLKSYLYGTGQFVKQFPNISPLGALWFLPSLFVSLLLFHALMKITKKYPWYIRIVLFFVISYIGLEIGKIFFLPWSIDISLVSLIFIYAGYLFKTKPIDAYPKWVFPICFIVWVIAIKYGDLSMNNRQYHLFPLALVGAIGAIIIFSYISNYLTKTGEIKVILTYLGSYSIIILIFHLFDSSYFHFDHYLPWIYKQHATHFMFRVVLSVLIIELIRRIPMLRKIYI